MTGVQNCIQMYQTITHLLFYDKVNLGRLFVLDQYTEAVCDNCTPYVCKKIIKKYFTIKSKQQKILISQQITNKSRNIIKSGFVFFISIGLYIIYL